MDKREQQERENFAKVATCLRTVLDDKKKYGVRINAAVNFVQWETMGAFSHPVLEAIVDLGYGYLSDKNKAEVEGVLNAYTYDEGEDT